MSFEKFCKILKDIKIDKNFIAQKKINKKAAYNKFFEKDDKNNLNYFKNILIFLLFLNLFCLSYSDYKIKMTLGGLDQNCDYKIINLENISNSSLKVNNLPKNANGTTVCYNFQSSKIYYINCGNDYDYSEFEIELEITAKMELIT